MYENANARLKRNNNVLEDKHGIDSTEEAVEKMDELKLEDTDAAYIAAFETLNQYAFDDDTMLGDWLISLGRQTSDEVDIKLLYPVIEAMGQNQAELSLSGGILSAVGNLGNNEDADEFEKMVKEIKSAIKEYNGKDSISIWENNDDDDITGKSIALTSDAIRKQSAKNILSKKDKWEIVQEKYEEIQKRIGIAMGMKAEHPPLSARSGDVGFTDSGYYIKLTDCIKNTYLFLNEVTRLTYCNIAVSVLYSH